ncbi:MAG: SCP2 sterol-binding domain-containing protein [Emcibacter sp.]|nr:SCP2 sterol-binding domain-containing protein [Emcibacter sp.]
MRSEYNNQNANNIFSPLLVAGMAMRSLPKRPLNHLLSRIAYHIQHNHPDVLERLRPITGCQFLICPTDLPHVIRLTVGDGHLDCVIEDEFMTSADVTISGPLMSLMDMMDGTIDGDALFFSRSLSIEGNTEYVLTLRNAIDSDDINLKQEILHILGPLKTPAEMILNIGRKLQQNLSRDMTIISDAITSSISIRCDGLEQENQSLRDSLLTIEKKLTKTQQKLQSLTRKSA